MRDFHVSNGLLKYDPLKISAILTISLKHKIFFGKFLQILLDNNVTSLHTHACGQSNNHSEVI